MGDIRVTTKRRLPEPLKVLVLDAYRLVVSGLPTSEQPVDPRT